MPPVSLNAHVRIPKHVLFQDLAGETILLNLETGTYFGLDPLGTRIWRLLQERRSLKTVHEAILDEYEIDASPLEADLLRLVRELARHGLIEHA
ncbi:MAG: PqqD family protein [Candidatus Omnitrophica bacterium]|nr:PqqD family protein [Candidatus Omnitrophota bacterium]